MSSKAENNGVWVATEIRNFVHNNPSNRLSKLDGTAIFEQPLIGFANAEDSLFVKFKDLIGPFHLSPMEVLYKSFPEDTTRLQRASVISWILPISKATRISNRKQSRFPSKQWAHTRTCGEEFNNELRRHIVACLQKQGFIAVAPALSEHFEVLQSDKHGFVSNWSERHIAHAAGLGTFGLSRGLITTKGVAMRCGSVVTNMHLNASPRLYNTHQAHCLFYHSAQCGKCIERCPGGAISEKGHNKERCMAHCYEIMGKAEEYDAAMPGCGLCQTGVPCEAGIPAKNLNAED